MAEDTAVLPTQDETKDAVESNKNIKKRYEQLLKEIGKSFRKQIKG